MVNSDNGRVIALGFFDGVHVGHGALLKLTRQTAVKLGAISCAYTFDAHPQTVITGSPVKLINTAEERADIMRSMYGIEEVIFSHFNYDLIHMKWDKFIEDILVNRLNAVHVVAGHDFRFGYKGAGNPVRLKEKCSELGIGCDIIERVEIDGITVSSTYIRKLIAQGDMERAGLFLGHPHFISGYVARGKGLGGKLGIPTANLELGKDIQELPYGVYITRTYINGAYYMSVTNVGVQPTVVENGKLAVETNILDYNGDIYDTVIRVEFLCYLRPEKRFESPLLLKKQIEADIIKSREYFSKNPELKPQE